MSFYSMKNKRQISKKNTLQKIESTAKKVYIKKGVSNTSTMDIAREAKIAHGTIFAHFSTKNDLVIHVFKKELTYIAKQLKDYSYDSHIRCRELVHNYLNLIVENEDLFITIAKEFPFYPEEVKREIIATESIVRILIYNKIETGIKNGIFKDTDITTCLSFLFGTLNYYLSRKEMFAKDYESIIQKKKNSIIKTFFDLLTL